RPAELVDGRRALRQGPPTSQHPARPARRLAHRSLLSARNRLAGAGPPAAAIAPTAKRAAPASPLRSLPQSSPSPLDGRLGLYSDAAPGLCSRAFGLCLADWHRTRDAAALARRPSARPRTAHQSASSPRAALVLPLRRFLSLAQTVGESRAGKLFHNLTADS